MWCKNIAGRFFGLATKHACDGRTDRITTPKTALAQLRRAVKTHNICNVILVGVFVQDPHDVVK